LRAAPGKKAPEQTRNEYKKSPSRPERGGDFFALKMQFNGDTNKSVRR
jgi:hypothetical protein